MREQDFTPEQEVLFWAIQLDGYPVLPEMKLLEREMGWPSLRRMAVDHGVLPLLYRKLKALEQNPAPAKEMVRFRELYLANSGANLNKELKLVKILELLSAQGIEAAVFKGPALALQAFGDPSLRQYMDLDILIHQRDLRSVYELMVDAGYTPQFPVDNKREKWLVKSDIALQFSGQDGLLVEVHWEMCERSDFFNIGSEAVWQNLQTVLLQGKEVRVPAPEHSLIMLWLHGFRHRWDRLKLVADLIHMVHSCSGQGRQVIADAREKLPPRYRDRFIRDITTPRILARAVFFPGSYRGMKEHFSDLAAEIFKPRPSDWIAVDLPDFLYPLYYLIRPVRLAVKYGRSSLRSLFSFRKSAIDRQQSGNQ